MGCPFAKELDQLVVDDLRDQRLADQIGQLLTRPDREPPDDQVRNAVHIDVGVCRVDRRDRPQSGSDS